MKKWLTLSMAALFVIGCAPKATVETPTVPIAENTQPEKKMYLGEQPSNEFYLQQEHESYDLRPVQELSLRESIVQNALMYLGKRDGGDCSGFVSLINYKTGAPFYKEKELSQSFDNARKSRAMFNLMSQKGNAYETRLPHLGDLVFFENTEHKAAVKTKGKGKNKVAVKKPSVQVAENITHVGIVTKVESDGTVEFIHHSNGKNILDYMNFNYPMLTNKDGKVINTYMKRCPSKGGAAQPQCMNIAFFVAYGTF
ncbi:hypothetical protein [Sulfurospirillum diekertiae]|uniref:Peptidase C51 domain-containing protein n=1 Tax=Sulfurospirillum diekertiae TaxID=1854492 RepID=A0A1Y0HLU9_9BACT|nr:hypothetical protein [Sulfurospirillum diekertiae]ARU49062.1 hypothetical protein Sdiek1_1903 [Sulfurospirillum diekertiae]ASC93877.1 hypothetical protein Sdiek2_1862 [Sulfurospirillum diekertiae]